MKLMKEKNKHIIALVATLFSSIVLLVFIFWWIYPYKTLEIKQPYKIINNEVKQGGVLEYDIDYCKYTKVQSVVRRQFVDGLIYATPEITANLKEGCGVAHNSITIPENLPVGEYYLDITISYQMNPIRIINHEAVTEKFTVIK